MLPEPDRPASPSNHHKSDAHFVEERKQAFVFTADLVNYSELVFRDAQSGIASLVGTRSILTEVIARFGGRVVSTPGDFVLAVFAAAADAVAAARESQRRLTESNLSAATKHKVTWRIGIAFGEVFEVGNDIYGHTVNVAARIQALGRPGDIVVSAEVRERLPATGDYTLLPLGWRQLKNIEKPMQVYRIASHVTVPLVAPSAPPSLPSELLKHLSKPTLRIEPFNAIGGMDRSALLARAIEDDIYVVLSRLSNSLTVIDRDDRTGAALANYVLKANLQTGGQHLRLTARLISVSNGYSIWAERYDCDLREEFELQDQIAREIVVALQFALTEGEQARFWNRGTQSGLAWEQFQFGRDQENRYTRDGHRRAMAHYREALRLDPSYLSALVSLGFCHIDEVRLGWSDKDETSIAEAEAAATRAAKIDSRHPDALSLLAFVRVMQGKSDEAIAAMDQAVAGAGLNSELVAYQGTLYDLLGNHHAAIRSYSRALSLSPHGKPWIGSNLGLSYLATGEAAEAERICRDVLTSYPDYARAWIGLSLALLRQYRKDEARAAASRVLLLDPRFTVADWSRSRPLNDEALLSQFMIDLREVGLPP